MEILNFNDIKSPLLKKTESTLTNKKTRNNNHERSNPQIPTKTMQKASINFKETQKKIEKKNEEMENALKNLVTVKREALIHRTQIRHNSNKIDAKNYSDQIKKSMTLKRKIPEITHKFTKKLINFQAETINFKDIFYLEPLENKLSRKISRKESDSFEETMKNGNNRKLAIVNRKFRKILTKIEKKEFPNSFNQVLFTNRNNFDLKKKCSTKSFEISTKVFHFISIKNIYKFKKDLNFLLEEAKHKKTKKEISKKRSASFSYMFDFKKSNDEIFSLKFFPLTTQSQISKSVSRESLFDKKKNDELKKNLIESPFIINFNLEEATQEPKNEVKTFFLIEK